MTELMRMGFEFMAAFGVVTALYLVNTKIVQPYLHKRTVKKHCKK